MTQAVATLEPRRSLLANMAGRYAMEPQTFANTLRATVVPKNATNEEFAAFLMVAKEYNLNPITKEIYAFPKQGGGIQPIVSVDGWANLINSNPQCDGFDFVDELDDKGNLVTVTCRIYRKDRSHPTTATEYMSECRRDTSTWKQWPRRMLRHKALIQAARYAFGFAGIVDPDEAERFTTAPKDHYVGAPGARMTPPPAPKLAPPAPLPVAAAEVVEEPQISEDETRALDRESMQQMRGETPEAEVTEADSLADWVGDRVTEANKAKSLSDLDQLDDQVCRETDDARREDLRTTWNAAYAANKTRLAPKATK